MEGNRADGTERGGAMKKLMRAPRGGICLAALGIAMMGFGIFRGELPVVLEKAVNICMECIGIG